MFVIGNVFVICFHVHGILERSDYHNSSLLFLYRSIVIAVINTCCILLGDLFRHGLKPGNLANTVVQIQCPLRPGYHYVLSYDFLSWDFGGCGPSLSCG